MIQYIEANGLFLNLGLIVQAEVVERDAAKKGDPPDNVLELTSLIGTVITIEADDAEATLQRLNILAMQTAAAANQLTAAIQEAERQAKGVTP